MSPAMVRGLGLLLVVSVIYGAGFLSAWKWQVGKFAGYREEQALDALVDMAHARAEQDKMQNRLTELDARHEEVKRNAEDREEQLLRDIESGRRRLSVLARECGAGQPASSSGMDDGTLRAELDPAHGSRVISITRDGDRAVRALSGLQDYVREVCAPDG